MCPLCRGPLEMRSLLEAARDEDAEDGGEGYDDIAIEVSSTKVNACLSELARIRRNTPEDKTIIVSQFTSFLSIIQPLLTEQGYKWTRLDGTMSTRHRANVIGNFQDTSPDSPKVLLLSLRAGNYPMDIH